MAEVKLNGLWKVTVTEYELGWGQSDCPNDTKYFDTEAEAKAYAKTQNTGSYDLYWRAEVRKV